MSSSKHEDVKPSWAILEGRKKPIIHTSDDKPALPDIKPVIPGLEQQGIDFINIRPHNYPSHQRHDQMKVYLTGTKGGVNYKFNLIVYPESTGQVLKKYLGDVYGYEVDKLRVLYDGKILANNDTMETLQVEAGDIFDVYLEQLGG
ncbi:hypothetical protein Q8F55_003469 [Vanrija albida]|uniref:Ubiquitin-like domain-containing protein n=1 Tax=Vanrija albida TaxID=181172 RepID=A0ABR3Q4W1_9TREE